jgi:hypothetical protein
MPLELLDHSLALRSLSLELPALITDVQAIAYPQRCTTNASDNDPILAL